MHKDQIDYISSAFDLPLPGWQAQQIMAPVASEKYKEVKIDSKKAAVMVLLHPDENHQLQIVFIKRPTTNPNDKHSGQISFAGGQVEEQDINLEATALRETQEELGIDIQNIKVLGALTPIYVYVSNFYVEPYVGYLNQIPKYHLQKEEVEHTITIPIDKFVSNKEIKRKDHKVRNFTLRNMPFYDLNGDVLWGATAMITAEFIELLRNLDH